MIDPYSSDVETRVTGSFDPYSSSPSMTKRIHRSDHIWKPQRTSSQHRARLVPLHRSTSSGRYEIDPNQYSNSYLSPTRSTYYPQITPLSKSPKRYRSSLYINRPNTYGLYDDKNSQNKVNSLYVDSQTGIV